MQYFKFWKPGQHFMLQFTARTPNMDNEVVFLRITTGKCVWAE